MSVTNFLDINVTERMSRIASEAIAEGQLVRLNASDFNQVDAADTADEFCIGVAEQAVTAQNVTDGDTDISIASAGRVKCLAGAAVSMGDAIAAEVTTGRGVPRTAAGATVLTHVIGYALTDAADGEFFTLLIAQSQVWAANAS